MSRPKLAGFSAIAVVAIGAATIALVPFEPQLLGTGNGWVRAAGRASVSVKAKLGTAGPEMLSEATFASIRATEGQERSATIEIIRAAVERLSPSGQRSFLTAVGNGLVESPSFDCSACIARNWGKDIDLGLLRAALLSQDPHAREGAWCSLVNKGLKGGASLREVAEFVNRAYEEARVRNDEEIIAEVLSLAHALELHGFLREKEKDLGFFARSDNRRLRRLAMAYLSSIELRRAFGRDGANPAARDERQ